MVPFRPLLPSDPPLAFLDCAPLGPAEAVVIAAVWGMEDTHDRPTRLLHVTKDTVCYVDVPNNIISVCRTGKQVLALAKSGFVYSILPSLGGKVRIGRIDGGTFLRLRDCGGVQFACGMNGQVVRRDMDTWGIFDDGLYSTERTVMSAQIRDIAGTPEKRLVAVGAFGDVFEFQGSWVRKEVSTNSHFEQILCDHENFWIAGQNGTLVLNAEDEWRVLDSGTSSWFWGMATFKDTIYLSSLDGLWTLDRESGTVAALDHGLDLPLTTYRLQSSESDLWSIGPDDIARFDGDRWHRISIPSNS